MMPNTFRFPIRLMVSVCLIAGLSHCASVHPGNDAVRYQGNELPLRVSAESIENDPDDAQALVELTFENKGAEWVKIDHVEVVLNGEAAKHYGVVVGKDLVSWAEARNEKLKLEEQHRQAILGVLALTNVALAATSTIIDDKSPGAVASRDLSLQTANNLVDASTNEKADATRRQLEDAVRWSPSHHVYEPFAVPGKLFLRRWLLLTKPTNVKLGRVVFNLHTSAGEETMYVVDLK